MVRSVPKHEAFAFRGLPRWNDIVGSRADALREKTNETHPAPTGWFPPSRSCGTATGTGGTCLRSSSRGRPPIAAELVLGCVATGGTASAAADASALAEDGEKLVLRLRARNENFRLCLDFGGVTGTSSAVDGLRCGMAGICEGAAGRDDVSMLVFGSCRPRRKSEMSDVRERIRPEGDDKAGGMMRGREMSLSDRRRRPRR